MSAFTLSQSARINAGARRVYDIIADYSGGHQHIVPPKYFTKLDVENIRTIDLGSAEANDLMLTGDQNLLDIAYSVRWNIRTPELYLFQLVQPDETIRQVAESAMRAVVSYPIRWLYGRADAIACITKSIVAEGREMGVPESRLPYIPNPVDTRRFVPVSADVKAAYRAEFGLDPRDVLFTVTGRLSREKGTREVLTAWRDVARAGRLLLMIGPGMPGHPWDESAWARAFIEREGLQGSVRLAGAKMLADAA